MVGWRRFVAVGDSFTEGLSDEYPGGGYRGWADLVAGVLAGGVAGFGYANLAVRGRLFDQVVAEQVPAALALAPDLVSFAAGGNDALRRSFDPALLARRVPAVVRDLRASGAQVLLFQFADLTTRLPGARVVRPRARLLNDLVAAAAADHGARVVNLWDDTAFHGPQLWSEDRLHLNGYGHRRVAALVLAALGLDPDPAWLAPPPPVPARTWVHRRGADLRWATTHLLPWTYRRLTGQSSGDRVTAKRPVLAPVDGEGRPGGTALR